MSLLGNSNLNIQCNHSIHYRADIDGIRAIAVLTVFLYHLFPKTLTGGFVGVDIFFVISGFLISSIIFKQLSEDKFSFYKFYSRRIRRIYPVLLLVLIFVLTVGFFYFTSIEYESLGKHAFGGSAFISNIFLWKEGGYFDLSAEQKPLLHLWSLGIEEQFYIIWPLALFLIYKIKKSLLFPFMVLTFIVSFAINIVLCSSHPTFVFFSPFSRFWELTAGALLAFVKLNIHNYKDVSSFISNKFNLNVTSNVLSFIGILLVCISITIVNNDMYPYFWGLLPVMACVCLIAAGPNAYFNKYILSNKLVVFIGLISYPMYLWHYPFISLYRILMCKDPSLTFAIIIIPIVILLSYLTSKYIEAPFRFGTHGFIKTSILFITMMIVGGYGAYTWYSKAQVFIFNDSFKSQAILNSALVTFSDIDENHTYQVDIDNCHINNEVKEGRKKTFCWATSSESSKITVMLGDSHLHQFYGGLKKYFGKERSLESFYLSGTVPLVNVISTGDYSINNYFQIKRFNLAFDYILNNKKIDSVIISHKIEEITDDETELNLIDLENPSIKQNDWKVNYRKGLTRTLDALKKANKKVFFIIDTPILNFKARYYLDRLPPFESNLKNITKMSKTYYTKSFAYKEFMPLYNDIVKNYDNVTTINIPNYLCDDNSCVVKEKKNLLYSPVESTYNPHTSVAGSNYIAPFIYEKLKNNNAFD